MNERYLYIFEDGTIKKGGEPSQDDIDCISSGMLEIIKTETMQHYEPSENSWLDLGSVSED